MREELGRPPIIAGHEAQVKVSSYYGGGDFTIFSHKWGPGLLAKSAGEVDADFLLFSEYELRVHDTRGLFAELRRLGFKSVHYEELPATVTDLTVFRRRSKQRQPSDNAPVASRDRGHLE
jgi:hypothetical protein